MPDAEQELAQDPDCAEAQQRRHRGVADVAPKGSPTGNVDPRELGFALAVAAGHRQGGE